MATVLFSNVGIYKLTTNLGGNAPTLGASDGILVGDRVVDNSTTPYKVWICTDNTNGAAAYIAEDAGNISTSQVNLPGVNVDPGYEVTLDKALDYIWSSGRVSGFALTDNGNGTISLAYGIAMLRNSDTMSPYFSQLYACKVPAANNISLTDNAVNYVYAQYHATTPTIGVSTDITTVHATDKVLLYIVTRVGTQLDYIAVGSYASDFMAKYAKKAVAQSGNVEYAYGAITSESGTNTRKLSVTAGCFYFINEQVLTSAIDTNASGTFTYAYRDGSGGWTRVASQTTINNTQYDDGSGTLATLTNNHYGVHWVYLILDNPTRMMVVYGQENYDTEAAATAAGVPTELPTECKKYSTGTLIAKIIIHKNDTSFYLIQNPFTTYLHTGIATEHNGLAGLQGGATDDYYHLTNAQHTVATTAATSGNDGYLTSSDWTTFNNKVAKLTANTTVNFNNTMTAVQIQALIDAQPKDLGGYTLTFQFADGTYTLSSALAFYNFSNGSVYIQGNRTETNYNSLHTTQSVFLDFTNNTTGLNIANLANGNFYVYNLKIRITDTASINAINVSYCTNLFVYYCYLLGAAKTTQNRGATLTFSLGRVDTTYFENLYYGLVASSGSNVYANNNDDVNTAPTYGYWAQGGIICKNTSGLVPAGTTANEYYTVGGQIFPNLNPTLVTFNQSSSDPTPVAGTLVMYMDTSNTLKVIDPSGGIYEFVMRKLN